MYRYMYMHVFIYIYIYTCVCAYIYIRVCVFSSPPLPPIGISLFSKILVWGGGGAYSANN